MAQPRLGQVTADLEFVPEAIYDIHDVLRGGLTFGNPQPSPNGTLDNMAGSWVIGAFTSLGGTFVFNHNLNYPVVATDIPNVVWTHVCFRHSGAGTMATSFLTIEYVNGSQLDENSIELTIRGAVRTVGAGANQINCVAYFLPVEQW